MNRVEHAMIDGSMLSLSAEVELVDLTVTPDCFGRVHVPVLNEVHRFEVHRPGFGHRMVAEPPPLPEGTTIGPVNEFSMKGGTLLAVEVAAPHPHGWMRHITVGSWEGTNGCIWTSRSHASIDEIVAIYDSVEFVDSAHGVYFTSPIEPDFRHPSCMKDIGSRALLVIRPLTRERQRQLPAEQGLATVGGALYRVNDTSPAFLLVTQTVHAVIDPLEPDLSEEGLLDLARSLTIEWNAPAD